MFVLGVTSDDKGVQLEALLESLLASQGYSEVRRNLISAGGNEIDVSAVRVSPVLSHTQMTPLMCEAKAYASALSMPTWHKFLGKLHLARAEDSNAIGILVALNGVNGNVAGSYAQLMRSDKAVFVIEGRHVAAGAEQRGELSTAGAVREALINRLGRTPVDLDVAYYAGEYLWVARWDDETYSVFTGHGEGLSTQQLTALTPALENSLAGTLIGGGEEEAEVESRHARRVALIGSLLRKAELRVDDDTSSDDAAKSLVSGPFCTVIDGSVRLVDPQAMDADQVGRLFRALFEHKLSVGLLGFAAEGLHRPYLSRLVDVMPEIQRGFELDQEGQALLHAVVPYFPSLWAFLSVPYEMITTHLDNEAGQVDPETYAADTQSFWSEVIRLVRMDYANPALRGLMYDHLGVAELATRTELIIKTKQMVQGVLTAVVRDAVRQMDMAEFGGTGIAHISIRMLPHAPEPWEDQHPEPVDLFEGLG